MREAARVSQVIPWVIPLLFPAQSLCVLSRCVWETTTYTTAASLGSTKRTLAYFRYSLLQLVAPPGRL